eukprot:SAG11_NODE_25684_length_355_cov_1.183594_1_plen_89_part_10
MWLNDVGRFDALMAYEHTDLDAVGKGAGAGWTALHCAALWNRPELAARLLADPRFTRWGAEGKDGDTALALAKAVGKSATAAAIEAGIA